MKNPEVIAAFQFNSELIFCSGYAHCSVKNTIPAKAHSLLTLKKICKETQTSARPVCTWQQCMAMRGRDTKAGSAIQKSRSSSDCSKYPQFVQYAQHSYCQTMHLGDRELGN